MTDIEPALTADEWKAMLADDQFPGGLIPPRVLLGGLRGEDVGAYVFKMVATFNAALPDDDPRKITRRDLKALDAEISVHDYELQALRAKLAALLPP